MSSKGRSRARYAIDGDAVRYLVEIDVPDGVAVVRDDPVCRVGDEMAVAWDSSGAVLLSHGERGRVEQRGRSMRDALRGSGHHDLAEAIRIVAFPVHETALEELNRCIAVTGRVADLEGRLAHLTSGSGAAPGARH
jgi:hypothetical protein